MKYYLEIIYDEPIRYKSLIFYPVKMNKYFYFHSFIDCLLIDKNSIPDIEIISMNYLEYIIRKKDNESLLQLFSLFALCTNSEEYTRNIIIKKNKPIIVFNEVEIDGDDLEVIREIILEQNLVTVPDFTIQKEIRDNLEAGRRIKASSSSKSASLEDQMIAYSIATGIEMEKIYNMSIRKFIKGLERIDAKIDYEMFLPLSLSGSVKFKNKDVLKHWRSDLTRDIYEDLKVDTEEMKNKLEFKDKKNGG